MSDYSKSVFPLFNSLLDDSERDFVITACNHIYKCINVDTRCGPDVVDFFIKNKSNLYLLRPSLIGLLINCPDFKTMSDVCVFISELIHMSNVRKADVNELLSGEITVILTDTIFQNALGKTLTSEQISSMEDYVTAIKKEVELEAISKTNPSLKTKNEDFEN